MATTRRTKPKDADPTTGEIKPAMNALQEAFPGLELIEPDEQDPLQVQRDIVGRVAKAKTLDELFGVWEARSSDALVDHRFEFLGVSWTIYNSENGPVPMARVDCVDLDEDDGSGFITTSPNITSFLARAEQLDLFPFRAKVVETKTARGFHVLSLRPIK